MDQDAFPCPQCQSCKLADSGGVINITKPFFNVWTAPPWNGTFKQGTSGAVGMRLPFSSGNVLATSGTSGGFSGVTRARGITQFYSRWRKYSTSSFVHQSSFTTYMKPTVTNKCIHSRRTTIAANNPIRRKALPNRRMDKSPLAHLCAPAKNSTSNPPTHSR